MRKLLVGVALLGLIACGHKHGIGGDDTTGGGDGGNQPPDACVGLQCQITDCSAQSKPPTTISGIVYAPNGTLPLVDVNVYVPNTDPGPFTPTVVCSHCSDALPGDPVVQTTTTETGGPGGGVGFTLTNVPDGANIPVVVTIGKWRRQITVPSVAQCGTTMLGNADTTLPKSRTDMTANTKSVDMPNIAISTGQADALECLVRKLGISDTEIKTDGQDGRIHLWSDENATGGTGISQFAGGFAGGTGAFANSEQLWGSGGDPGKLGNYDIVILSCEGGQHEETKPQAAMDHLKAYADVGGRVFLSHWHNIWIEGDTENSNGATKPAVWPAIATFNDSNNSPNNLTDLIDLTNNPKGSLFEAWMDDPMVMGSTTLDQVAIENGTGKNTCTSVDETKGEDWVSLPDGTTPQMFQFETPNEMEEDARCGKVVFSDMHVSGDSKSKNGDSYPNDCSTAGLTPQEKALAFMFFDISSCDGSIN